MVELNAPTITETNFSGVQNRRKDLNLSVEVGQNRDLANVEMATAAQQQAWPQQRSGLVIAIPIQRADLPAISLMVLAFTVIGCWFWVTNHSGGLLATGDPLVVSWEPLVPSLLGQKTITLTLTLTLTLLILATALAVSPLRWWAYLRFVAKTGLAAQFKQFQHRSPEAGDAEAWVAAQAAWLQESQATIDQATIDQATEARAKTPAQSAEVVSTASTDVGATAQAGAQQAIAVATQTAEAASPAVTEEAADQQVATPVADAQQANTTQPDAGQPDAGQPEAQSSVVQPKPALTNNQQSSAEMAALTEETKEEDLDLEDLTDVQDLLSSFADNDIISPQLLVLSASLDDVDLTALVKRCHLVAEELANGSPHGSGN